MTTLTLSKLKIDISTSPSNIWILGSFFIIMLFLYTILMIGVASNTSERGNLGVYLPIISAEVSDLEFSHLALKGGINRSLVEERGLVLVDNVDFVSSSALGHQIDSF